MCEGSVTKHCEGISKRHSRTLRVRVVLSFRYPLFFSAEFPVNENPLVSNAVAEIFTTQSDTEPFSDLFWQPCRFLPGKTRLCTPVAWLPLPEQTSSATGVDQQPCVSIQREQIHADSAVCIITAFSEKHYDFLGAFDMDDSLDAVDVTDCLAFTFWDEYSDELAVNRYPEDLIRYVSTSSPCRFPWPLASSLRCRGYHRERQYWV